MRDALALLEVQHHARVLVEQRMVVVERARVLCDRVQQPGEGGPRLAVHRMRVRGADHVGTGGVHLRMDGEGRLVQRAVTLDDRAVVAHQHQVAYADVAEVHAERVDPEVVGHLGIAGGDVARDALVESEAAEQTERGSQVLFAVQAFFFDGAALVWEKRRDVAACESAGLLDVVVSHGPRLPAEIAQPAASCSIWRSLSVGSPSSGFSLSSPGSPSGSVAPATGGGADGGGGGAGGGAGGGGGGALSTPASLAARRAAESFLTARRSGSGSLLFSKQPPGAPSTTASASR